MKRVIAAIVGLVAVAALSGCNPNPIRHCEQVAPDSIVCFRGMLGGHRTATTAPPAPTPAPEFCIGTGDLDPYAGCDATPPWLESPFVVDEASDTVCFWRDDVLVWWCPPGVAAPPPVR